MPKNTGIKNREDYLRRIIDEDKKIAGKDAAYGAYLAAITALVDATNQIYEAGGTFTKESYDNLMDKYRAVAECGVAYKESAKKGSVKERQNVVNYIQKVISKDMAALNGMNKDKLNTLDELFEQSRAPRVIVPNELKNTRGGQGNERIPIKTSEGKKGYFTIKTDLAQNDKWEKAIDEILSESNLSAKEKAMIEKLKTDLNLRDKLLYPVLANDNTIKKRAGVVFALGLAPSEKEAINLVNENKDFGDTFANLVKKTEKLLSSYALGITAGGDPYKRYDNKNAAMYDVAKLMGCNNLLPKAVPMVIVKDGKAYKGTFMENAQGTDTFNIGPEDPLWDYKSKDAVFEKDFLNDLADLQMLDYICGNIDRHMGNIFFKSSRDSNGNVVMNGVVGIDNDACFPEDKVKSSKFKNHKNDAAKIFKPENFKFVNEKTANIVKNLTRGQLETVLRGHNLSPKAIESAWERLKDVQTVLKEMENHKIKYTKDISEINPNVKDADKNPFAMTKDSNENPSIFDKFNDKVEGVVNDERKIQVQKQYFRKLMAQKSAKSGKDVPLDMEEYKEFYDKEQLKREMNEGKKADRESSFIIDFDKIKRMNTVMKHANELKSATQEFANMRQAMFELSGFAEILNNRLAEGNKLTDEDYNNYKTKLDQLNNNTKAYMAEKGLTPKTAKGKQRLEAAQSIENRVEELLDSFEAAKHLDQEEMINEENVL